MNTSDTNSAVINSKYTSENKIEKSEKITGKDIVIRTIDILGGLVGLIILIPLTIVVWVLNKKNKEDRTNIFCARKNRFEWQKVQDV